MRAAIFNGMHRPVTIERVDDPAPAPDEVVVQVQRCGICGSDVSLAAGDALFAPPAGSGFGHEYSGQVVAVGRQVTTLKDGDRVACMPTAPCGHCDACVHAGSVFHCSSLSQQVKTHGLADFVTVAGAAAIPLPRGLSFADGALVEPMACGLHACDLASIRGGERLLILGGGAMALAVIGWARVLGAGRIVVLNRSAHRRDLLLASGADAVFDFDTEAAAIRQALGGAAEIVVECIGKPGMLQRAIDTVRVRGTVVSMGMCAGQENLTAAQCAFKEIRLLFPFGWSATEFIDTLSAIEAGRLRPATMVDQLIPLEALPATLERLHQGTKHHKVHVDLTLRGN